MTHFGATQEIHLLMPGYTHVDNLRTNATCHVWAAGLTSLNLGCARKDQIDYVCRQNLTADLLQLSAS